MEKLAEENEIINPQQSLCESKSIAPLNPLYYDLSVADKKLADSLIDQLYSQNKADQSFR